ncbi:hypothetical protein MUK60_17490 [Streptomyces sp. LRE541]|uniref:hypothetical protein n=1 Tax=Streptomyces sp. LRE541 TaxID=2931983 RepID=UPI00200DC991|nr:hypothetical protein [Streptomyces sp. LRE541]UPZ29442.1 hypothetical protein MUK60_17490 [Streptomyces sp. LRE541]
MSMRMRFSRPLVAAAAVAALGCVAACGAGGDADGAGQDGKSARSKAGGRADGGEKAKTPAEGSQDAEDPQATGGTGDTQDTRDSQDTGDPQGSSGGAPKDAGPLTKAQLKKAALATDDVKGFEVKESEGADLLGQTVPATPSKCQPIADMFLFSTDPASRAGVSRGAVSKDETNASVITFALLAYKSGEADEVIDGLRSATKGCTAYRHADYDYKNVKAAADPGLGDESVAFRLVASIEGAQVPAAYTVVRDGTTLVAFSSMNMLDADEIEVPAELVKAQLAKLAKPAKTTG